MIFLVIEPSHQSASHRYYLTRHFHELRRRYLSARTPDMPTLSCTAAFDFDYRGFMAASFREHFHAMISAINYFSIVGPNRSM